MRKILTLEEIEMYRRQINECDWAHNSGIYFNQGEAEKLINTIYHLLEKVAGLNKAK